MSKYKSVIRLAIVSSHPIQYNAPLFSLLSSYDNFEVKVFYGWKGGADKNDPEFKKKITWDIPLLEGYEYCFNNNIAKDPGTHHFFGLNNPDLIGEIERWEANCVLVYGWAFKTHLAVLRYFHGRIPVFFRGDSTLLSQGTFYKRLMKKIYLTWVYRYVDVAFYPGQHSKAYFLSYGLPEKKLRYLPHSIDNARFSSNSTTLESESLAVRKKMKIPDDSFVLLFAGKLVTRKQPVFLLNVVKELVQKENLNIHLIFVGTGPLESNLKLLAENAAYIHFLGFKNQTSMPLMYRLGDVYCLPSTIETWGLGVNEAMACSRPVLVSHLVGCAPDLVKKNISGSVFSAKNKESAMKAIRDFVNRKKSTLEMREASRELIEGHSIEKVADQLVDHISTEMNISDYYVDAL